MMDMIDGMMSGGPIMWAMSFFWLLTLALLILGIAALVKHLFFNKRR